ncbi:MAG: GWxTD domain-containing protein [Gemmatimonadaceae bacterium]|nr:GWxTD domain-containing protein [Gemmatimonadaceae bacterium]
MSRPSLAAFPSRLLSAALFVLASGAPAPVFAQQDAVQPPPRAATRIPTDALVRDARSLADRGDTTAALELLERATDQSPRDAEALYWRGMMLMRQSQLNVSDAADRFIASRLLKRAADLDGTNPRYQLALGRLLLRSPLQRVQAERHFRKALSIAGASRDTNEIVEATRELGEVKRRRYLTGRDRRLYTTSNTFDPNQALIRLHYTREFLEQLSIPVQESGNTDRFEAEEYFRQALRFRADDVRSVVALLGILYDQKRLDEMLALVRSTVAANPAGAVAANARPFFAAGLAAFRLGRVAEADSLFNQALARLLPAERIEMLELGRILRVGDSVRVAGLSPEERARTDSAYWEAADPLLATPQNEARLEYLSRMAYADLEFTDEDTRQAGWRTDRAMILARYGEPPVIATFSPQVNIDARDAIGRVITVWFYPRAEVDFVFTGPPAFNYAYFAGNYRDHARAQREVNPFALENLALAMRTDTIPVQMARFRGIDATQMEVVVAGAVPVHRLYAGAPLEQGSLELQVRAGLAGQLALISSDTARVALPVAGSLARQWVRNLPARDGRLRLEAFDDDLEMVGARAQLDLPALRTDSMTIARSLVSSDLLMAHRVEPPMRMARWSSIGVRPLGDLRIAPRDTFSVYWELYGLTPDNQQRLRYDVEVQVTILSLDRGADPLARFFGGVADLVGVSAVGEDKLALKFSREEPASSATVVRQPELLTLGLGTSPAGRYRLTVSVTDKASGRVATSHRDFSIARP